MSKLQALAGRSSKKSQTSLDLKCSPFIRLLAGEEPESWVKRGALCTANPFIPNAHAKPKPESRFTGCEDSHSMAESASHLKICSISILSGNVFQGEV